MKKKVYICILSIMIVCIIIGIIVFICKNINKENEQVQIYEEDNTKEVLEKNYFPASAVMTSDDNDSLFLKRGDRVTILEENVDNNTYLIEKDGVKVNISKDKVIFFKFNDTEKYSLAVDVSQFNIVGQESVENPNKNFKDEIDFADFIISNNINYAYIRLGGRGYGTKGVMYYDKSAREYIKICEYLKIPYGFYFLDEALNESEVVEEVEFVNAFLDEEKLEMNVLPLALDLEYQHGEGRTDNMWDKRVPLVNKLVEEFKNIGIDTIIYANGARIETYLKGANCKFWTAMYREDNKIPKTNYQTMINEEQKKNEDEPLNIEKSVLNTKLNKGGTETITYTNEYLDKVIAWQFSESGANKDGIETYIDLSIIDNEYFITNFKISH